MGTTELIGNLDHDDLNVRRAAVDALGELGKSWDDADDVAEPMSALVRVLRTDDLREA